MTRPLPSLKIGDAPSTAPLQRGAVVEIPPTLLAQPREGGFYDLVILGAGCAGLSLCDALLSEGEKGSILLIDRRTDYADDRTWSFWDVEPTPFSHLARASWSSCTITSADGRAVAAVRDTPYLSLAANDFYRCCLDRLMRAGNVTMLAGDSATSYSNDDGLVTVTTSRSTITAGQVIDSRGLRFESGEVERAKASATWIPQEFVGLHIRTEKAAFDPAECTLMDFDVDQSSGLRFVYALAASPTELLVEDVSMSEPTPSAAEHRQNIADYLLARYGLRAGDYEVLAEEAGYIPMTDHRFARHPVAGVTTLGTLGGATRPSTGYTFLRIQRSSRELARRLVAGVGPDASEASSCSILDAIFLRFLADHPDRAARVFHLLFSRVESASLIRFLSEQSTSTDHARLILALPKLPFLATAFRVLLERGRRVLAR